MNESEWDALMAQLSPAHFARLGSNGRFQIPKHIACLNEALNQLMDGELEGLLVSMPPRHGKSHLCSEFFPAYFLGKNPDKRVILVSAEAQLAAAFGRKARDHLSYWGPQLFGVDVRRDSRAADHWNLQGRSGGMDTAGVGGSLTGRGANLFVVDDLVKNSEQALSETWRAKAWDLWLSCVETRAEPGCVFLVVGTRWHEDDTMGRIRKEILSGLRPRWKILSFPAIAEGGDGDILGRTPGEPLWPARYPAEKILAMKTRWDHDEARLGPYWFEALYQQNPTPREGGLFKRSWFRYYEEDAEFYTLGKPSAPVAVKKDDCWRCITVDPAVSEKQTADFFALGVWAITPDRDLVLLDVVHEHLAGPDQVPLIERLNERYQPNWIGVESVAYQLALVQSLVRTGAPVREVRADRDKVARAQLPATRFSAGTVYFPKEAAWLSDLERELMVFPNGRNDDLVDMVSIAANELASSVPVEVYT